MKKKRYTSIYVTCEAIMLIQKLSEHMGISRNAVFEIAVRLMADREHIVIETELEANGE